MMNGPSQGKYLGALDGILYFRVFVMRQLREKATISRKKSDSSSEFLDES